MAKTMETSRDDEHEEDVVPRSMFETLWEGVCREMRRGHRRRQPPLEDEAHPRRRCQRQMALLRGTWRGRR